VTWGSKFQSGSWSNAPTLAYTNFRAHAQRLPPVPSEEQVDEPKCNNGADIVMIHRAKVSNNTCAGSCRRHLDISFIPAFIAFMKSFNSSAVFRIVETDNMDLKEQIKIISTARMIIGIHGAGLSNWAFAGPSTIVVELGHIQWPCYEPLAKRLELEYKHCADIKFTSCIKSVLSNYASISNSFKNAKNLPGDPW